MGAEGWMEVWVGDSGAPACHSQRCSCRRWDDRCLAGRCMPMGCWEGCTSETKGPATAAAVAAADGMCYCSRASSSCSRASSSCSSSSHSTRGGRDVGPGVRSGASISCDEAGQVHVAGSAGSTYAWFCLLPNEAPKACRPAALHPSHCSADTDIQCQAMSGTACCDSFRRSRCARYRRVQAGALVQILPCSHHELAMKHRSANAPTHQPGSTPGAFACLTASFSPYPHPTRPSNPHACSPRPAHQPQGPPRADPHPRRAADVANPRGGRGLHAGRRARQPQGHRPDVQRVLGPLHHLRG